MFYVPLIVIIAHNVDFVKKYAEFRRFTQITVYYFGSVEIFGIPGFRSLEPVRYLTGVPDLPALRDIPNRVFDKFADSAYYDSGGGSRCLQVNLGFGSTYRRILDSVQPTDDS